MNSKVLNLYFFTVSSLLLKKACNSPKLWWFSHRIHPVFYWVWWTSLQLLFWILYLVSFLSPLHSVVFLREPHIWKIFFERHFVVPSFCLTLCFFLRISALSPSLERVALCRRCPIRSSGAISPGQQSQVSQGIPCVGCVPPVMDGQQLLQLCWWVRLVPRQTWLWLLQMALVGQAGPWPKCLRALDETAAGRGCWCIGGLLSSQGKAGAGQVVLVRLMETDWNGAQQYHASYMERK